MAARFLDRLTEYHFLKTTEMERNMDDDCREEFEKWYAETYPSYFNDVQFIAGCWKAWKASWSFRKRNKGIDHLVDRFLCWPLPESVSCDPCACVPGSSPHRVGTNILTAYEARKMLEYVIGLGLHATAEIAETHPMFEAFIRAFWRRIEPYKKMYGKELPGKMPVEFRASMATALLMFDRD